MEDICGDGFEQGSVLGKSSGTGTDHYGHCGWAPTDRRIDQLNMTRMTGCGNAGHGLRRIGGQINMGGTSLQPGEYSDLRFEHRHLEVIGAGKRGEHHLAVTCRVIGAVCAHCSLRAQSCRSLRTSVINGKRMAG